MTVTSINCLTGQESPHYMNTWLTKYWLTWCLSTTHFLLVSTPPGWEYCNSWSGMYTQHVYDNCRLSPRVLHETPKLSIKMPNAPWPIYVQNVKCNSVETWYVELLKTINAKKPYALLTNRHNISSFSFRFFFSKKPIPFMHIFSTLDFLA